MEWRRWAEIIAPLRDIPPSCRVPSGRTCRPHAFRDAVLTGGARKPMERLRVWRRGGFCRWLLCCRLGHTSAWNHGRWVRGTLRVIQLDRRAVIVGNFGEARDLRVGKVHMSLGARVRDAPSNPGGTSGVPSIAIVGARVDEDRPQGWTCCTARWRFVVAAWVVWVGAIHSCTRR
jgi:hypothetical protein